jgi:Domain of unknown function (DUF4160)
MQGRLDRAIPTFARLRGTTAFPYKGPTLKQEDDIRRSGFVWPLTLIPNLLPSEGEGVWPVSRRGILGVAFAHEMGGRPSAIIPISTRDIIIPSHSRSHAMPTISMFYGILVAMYVLDTDKHHLPHIHVRYNEFHVVLGIPEGFGRQLSCTPDEVGAGLDRAASR